MAVIKNGPDVVFSSMDTSCIGACGEHGAQHFFMAVGWNKSRAGGVPGHPQVCLMRVKEWRASKNKKSW